MKGNVSVPKNGKGANIKRQGYTTNGAFGSAINKKASPSNTSDVQVS